MTEGSMKLDMKISAWYVRVIFGYFNATCNGKA